MSVTPEKIVAFCAALAETAQVAKACAAVGVSRWTAYRWRKEMPEFAEAWDDAMKAALLRLEDEAHRRAFDGIDEPLTHQGQFTYLWRDVLDDEGNPVLDENGMRKRVPDLDENGQQRMATMRKYSDTLAIFLLKSHAPEKYRDNSKIELAGHLAVSQMSEDEIKAELAALVAHGAAVPGAVNGPPGDDNDESLI